MSSIILLNLFYTFAHLKRQINDGKIKELVNKHNTLLYSVHSQHFTNLIENYFSMMKSRLYKLDGLTHKELKTNLRSKGYHHQDRMGLHSEVLNSSDESLDVFLDRVKILEGKKIDIKDHNNYDIVGRAIGIMLGDLEGYNKDAKITIAYLPDVNLNEVLKVIYQYIDSI